VWFVESASDGTRAAKFTVFPEFPDSCAQLSLVLAQPPQT
jgi:hypothetical protein